MKISTKSNSRFLSQEDVPVPFVAIIQDVRVEKLKSNRGEEEKYVLYFVTGKPMVCNVVNRKALVAVYGDQSDAWIGKPVEIYVNPDVYMGSERTGGIRVRIPTGPAPIGNRPGPLAGAYNGTAPKPAPPPAPTPPPALKPTPPTLEQQHERALDGMNHAQDRDNLDAWARWAKGFPFDERQRDALEDAYQHSLERIALAVAPIASRRPRLARA